MAVSVLADSQGKYWENDVCWAKRDVVRSYSGFRVQDVMKEDVADFVRCSDTLWLNLGTNNVATELPSSTVRHYRDFLRNLRELSPQCTIFVSSVLPRALDDFRKEKDASG